MKTGRTILNSGIKRITALSFAAFMIVALPKVGAIHTKVYAEESNYGLSNPKIAYNTRETVIFGSYWQEDTNGDGVADESDKKQPVTWQILEEYSDGTALVISDKILDAKPYNSNGVLKNNDEGKEYRDYSCTWETSTVRNWLNTDFYNNAFSKDDKTAIIETDVVNDDNPSYGTVGGENTKDNVFLLSLNDIKNPSYGFNSSWGIYDQGRTAKITSYTKSNDVSISADDTGYWWLRSPGKNADEAALVIHYGCVRYGGSSVDYKYIGIRPALRIDISSPYIKAGGSINASVKGSEWDTVTFGKYNGNAISWRILNVTGNNAFLVSNEILTKKAYNDERTFITWKDSTIRAWLNEDFINSSFNDAEKKMIYTSTVINMNNTYYGIEGGEDTLDKVFLLSLYDIVQPGYGFTNQYWVWEETRVAKDSDRKTFQWWLRSPGDDTSSAAIVLTNGYVYSSGFFADKTEYGIRPALWINLKSSAWEKGDKVTVGDTSGAEEVMAPTHDSTPILASDFTEESTEQPTKKPSSVQNSNIKSSEKLTENQNKSKISDEKGTDKSSEKTAKSTDSSKIKKSSNESATAKSVKKDGVGTISADGKTLTDTDGVKYIVAEKLTAKQVKKNAKIADKKSAGKYKITKVTKKNGKITGGTVTYMKPYNKNCKKANVKASIKLSGATFKVTAIANKAFKDCKNLTKVTIKQNIKTIGKYAFEGCTSLTNVKCTSKVLAKIGAGAFSGDAKLTQITLKTTKLKKKTVGKNAIKGTPKNLKIAAPKKVKKSYQNIFRTKGNKKVTTK